VATKGVNINQEISFVRHRSDGRPSNIKDLLRDINENKDYWAVRKIEHAAFDAIRADHLLLRLVDVDTTGLHSCYEFQHIFKTRSGYEVDSGTFCYPSVIVTGVRKCSTSALFALLESFPGAVGNENKENCALVGSRSIIDYFKSLPRHVEAGEVIVDGCVDLNSNIFMREILKGPNTFYVVRRLITVMLITDI
jgi:hypothetical protein